MIILIITIIIFIILLIIIYNFSIYQKFKRARLRKLAINIIEKLNNHDIDYWVDYGTLLGIIRENDIILYDNDVDICIKYNNFDELKKKLKVIENELKPNYYLEYYDWGVFRIKERITGYFADLYLIKEKDNMYIDPTGKIPKDYIGNKNILWNGLKVRIPEKTKETLIWRYGSDYMTPIKGKKNIN